jgi:hypothetical protein
MELKTYFGGSCAVSAIQNLGSHKNAEDALKSFCSLELGIKDPVFNPSGAYSKLACFYVFSAGPEVPKDHPNGSHHSKDWTRYGTEFAQFITDNSLGEIVTVGPKFNVKHHPKTTAQVWLWNPNQTTLEAWWDAYQKGNRRL